MRTIRSHLKLLAVLTVSLNYYSLEAVQLTSDPNPYLSTDVKPKLHQSQLDAPQYYSLNALLYKSKSGSAHTDSQANDGSQSHPGRRLNGVADLRPRDHDEPHTSEENSSLDTLVRSMHGNKDRGADSSLGPVSKRAGRHDIATDGSSFLGDDSLTQKKANSISSEADEDDSPSQINSSARIRDRGKPTYNLFTPSL